MKTNQAGLALIKEFEGCKLAAYRDSVGVLTIGYGHTSAAGPPYVTEGLVISQARADEVLSRDLGTFETAVAGLLAVPTTENQFAALVSFAFNLGPDALRRSTLLKLHNAGRADIAAHEFGSWIKAGGKVLPGLVRRRMAEAKLYQSSWSSLKSAPVGPSKPETAQTAIKALKPLVEAANRHPDDRGKSSGAFDPPVVTVAARKPTLWARFKLMFGTA